MLADWPGSANGSAPLIRIVGEPCIPPAGRLCLVSDHMTGDGHAGAAFQHVGQPLLQQRHIRAAGYRQHRHLHLELLLPGDREAPARGHQRTAAGRTPGRIDAGPSGAPY
jgi:hypothetical protein